MPPAPRHRSFSPWLRVVIGWALLCPFLSSPPACRRLACRHRRRQVPVPKAAPKAPAQKDSRADAGTSNGSLHHRSPHPRGGRSSGNSGAFVHSRRRDGFHPLGRDDRIRRPVHGKARQVTPADHTRRDRIDRGGLRRQGRLVAVAADRPDAGAGDRSWSRSASTPISSPISTATVDTNR